MTGKETSGIKPEIIAAICAGVNMILEEEKLKARAGRIPALRFKRSGGAWVTAGRQKIMDSRL